MNFCKAVHFSDIKDLEFELFNYIFEKIKDYKQIILFFKLKLSI